MNNKGDAKQYHHEEHKMHGKKIFFQYGKQRFSSVLRYSDRKTVGISIFPDKKIEVTAPAGTDFALVQRVVERKSKWISKKFAEMEKYQMMEHIKEYTGGQSLKILGRDYMIKIVQIPDFEEEEIIKEHKLIKVYVHDSSQKERISLLIEDWYRTEAMIYIAQKFELCYARIKKYGIPKPSYYLRNMKRRWGSCTSQGNILLNPEIFQLPSHCIEYVIMHELCHLKYKNHSKEFYHFLSTVLPDWEEKAKTMDSFLQV